MGIAILMLLAAVAPAIMLLLYVRWSDRHKPEPFELLLAGVRFGTLAAVVAAFVESALATLLSSSLNMPIIGSVLKSFVLAGCCEEAAKLVAFHLLVRKNRHFDEYFDGIVYCASVGLGFAAFENVFYIFQAEEDSRIMLALMRAIFSVPGHYAFAVIMGSLYALVHFDPERNHRLRPWIFLAPVLAHGIYDTLCFWQTEALTDFPLLSMAIFIMLIVFCIKMHKWAKHRFDMMLSLDRDMDAITLYPEKPKSGVRIVLVVGVAVVAALFMIVRSIYEETDKAFQKYQEGNALEQKKEYDEAFRLYQESADGGSSAGVNAVGFCYEYGRGVQKNDSMAFHYYQRAAEMDNYLGKYNLARFYLKGIYIHPDTAVARGLFEQATDYVDSNIYLGLIYQYGYHGFEPDETRALECYDRADNMGSAAGKFAADALRVGLKIPFKGFFECADGFTLFSNDKYRAAVTRLGEAKSAGNTAALSLLSYAFHTGKGIKKDDAIAYYHCLEGAERGDEICLGYMGDFYLHGIYVPKDTLKALQYYQMAPHSYRALFALAELYETGARGIPVDTIKSKQYRIEARQKELYIKLYRLE